MDHGVHLVAVYYRTFSLSSPDFKRQKWLNLNRSRNSPASAAAKTERGSEESCPKRRAKAQDSGAVRQIGKKPSPPSRSPTLFALPALCASAHESDRVVQISGDVPAVLKALVEIKCQFRYFFTVNFYILKLYQVSETLVAYDFGDIGWWADWQMWLQHIKGQK
ncbi:hypothetical protein Ddye_029883 [Dipteronia dyeriana]|uniref:Uncharacterized protein n=1 Tax=Dipteronia dyeriana TaxID=168575 RepID=A0AAD9TFZ9_9ROSI|nr:hypothetical protein Ddye_029883 [Dipteronia dyeriana]